MPERQPDTSLQLGFYRQMLTIRRFEERCNALYMQGRIPSTLHLYVGQEAVAVGVCAHLTVEDTITSTHRPHGHAIAKGVSLNSIMAELFAKDTGCCRGKGGSMHVGDMRVGMVPAIAIVGGGIPITTGMALAYKQLDAQRRSSSEAYRDQAAPSRTRVAVAFFGEGASNEGAFHEALNMAAIWRLPAVFVCENNLYAASTPVSWAFKVQNVADRAPAYGLPGEIVDGNDVLAVYEAAGRAIDRARSGDGPTLLECKTYRMVGHSRSDPRTYRSKDEETEWAARDPILRLATHLTAHGQITDALLAEIEAQVAAEIDDAVAFAEASPYPAPADALKHVFWNE
jgi:TPP-dependent pyruvate/acetoin dehydrogenase alpha subunit